MEDKSDSCDYSAQGVNTEPLECLRRGYPSHAGSQNTRIEPPQNYENTVSTKPLYRVEGLDRLYSVQWLCTKNSRYFNPYNKNSVHNMVIKRSLLGAQSKHYLLTLLMPSPLHRISINCANPLKSQTSFSTGRSKPRAQIAPLTLFYC